MVRNSIKVAIAAAVLYSTNAAACLMYFDFKGVQDGVQFGDCSCDGRYIGTGSWQQCYNATTQLTRQAQAKAQAQAQAQAEAQARAQAEADAQAKAEAEAKAKSKLKTKPKSASKD